LNVPFGASETEIKKQFRKLAAIHHPDKNAGSKKSEETFKIILNAYETLTNKEKRATYDLKYKQRFQQTKTGPTNQNFTYSNTKKEQPGQPPPGNKEYQRTEITKQKVNYIFWIILIVLALLYLFSDNKSTTTGNPKADKALEEQIPENSPQSGEIDFNE
jgi:curved DNA-binding protein CbpA